jgi:hypothetical protein
MLVLTPAIRPPPRPVRRRALVRPRADLNSAIELTGKFIGLFVLFTSTMNWWTYRKIRKDHEDRENKK